MSALVVDSVDNLKAFEGVENYEVVSRLIIIKCQHVLKIAECGIKLRGVERKDLGMCIGDYGAMER